MPTTWVQYGYDMAVLSGDALLLYAFETAAKTFTRTQRQDLVGKALHVLAEKSGIYGMYGGQTLDVELTGKPIDEDQLTFIYQMKTAALLQAAMMIGAILGGADETQIKIIEQMAEKIGVAFQIQDDVLDVIGEQSELGKEIGSDARNGKTTYVTLYGLTQAIQKSKDMMRQALQMIAKCPGDHTFLTTLVERLIDRQC
jgi:geranylgeranyl diphosphate synthase type II